MFWNHNNAIFSQATRRFSYQYVYRRILGSICREQNNRDSIFNAANREPVIQKVPKYGTTDPHMLYKISCPYFI